jgi:hypothetical protein
MDLNRIIQLLESKKINWSQHILKKMQKRRIMINDIMFSIKNGEIIENYPDDYSYPSCLVLGYNKEEKPIHIVCAVGNDSLWMITTYYPDEEIWKDDFKNRR